MTGRPTLWVSGTDHAGIATQNMVEQKLAKEGKSRHDLGREEFIEACWEWRREYGGTIIGQLKAMGCSLRLDHERFTMDPGYASAPSARSSWTGSTTGSSTAASASSTGARAAPPRSPTSRSSTRSATATCGTCATRSRSRSRGVDHVVVATTRPETMLGDTVRGRAPGRRALPGARRRDASCCRSWAARSPSSPTTTSIPSFGTGAVKVTPAHDPNDFEIGERHGCAKINIMNADATINEEGGAYAGLDRYEARERVVADLEAAGLLVKTDDHVHSVGPLLPLPHGHRAVALGPVVRAT